MSKDLTNSSVHRQNILNNPYALHEIEKATRISGIPFGGRSMVLKKQVASFFEVTPAQWTITSKNTGTSCAKTGTR